MMAAHGNCVHGIDRSASRCQRCEDRQTIAELKQQRDEQAARIAELEARVIIERNDNEMYVQQLRELRQKLEPSKEYAWECNECGSQEYTMSVSESDVQQLGCGGCGGDEWHKAEVKP